MATNDFLTFAGGGGANSITQAAYAALTTIRANGFIAGTAESNQLNKVWRQSSIMAAVLGQVIGDISGQNAIDDGTTATLVANLKIAIAVPPGTIIYTAANAAPIGFFKANGAAVSRTTYATLFSVLGTLFGVGDGTTTFNLPDLRGEFMRAWDDGRGVDIARTLGSSQIADAGSITINTATFAAGAGAVPILDAITVNGINWNDNTAAQTVPITPGNTRPRNVAFLACIRY